MSELETKCFRLPSYGYNAQGTHAWSGMLVGNGEMGDLITDVSGGLMQLGLGVFGRVNVAVPASRVLAPSDMIGVLDTSGSYEWRGMDGFGWPGSTDWSHEGQRNNAVFCDAHVETSRNGLISQETNQWGAWEFKPDETHTKRWNNDNQPHPETWPHP